MKRSAIVLCLAFSGLVVGACSAAASSLGVGGDTDMVIDAPEPGDDGPAGYAQIEFYDALVEERVVVLTGEEEDWCATFEGRAGGWLAAHELGLGDASTGEPFAFDSATVGLREIAASEAATGDSDEFASIEPFLRLPVPSPLVCRTAFGVREE